MATATVVGSGPNGLAAAITLARAGIDVEVREAAATIGGGARSAELTVPGIVHDLCSAVHPFAVASPFFADLPLAEHGLEWDHPDVLVAHPLDGAPPGVLRQSLPRTAEGLGTDGPRWRQLFEPLVDNFDAIAHDSLRPLLRVPQHPMSFLRFGLRAAMPLNVLGAVLSTPQAKALLAGNAAHIIRPLRRPLTSSVGVMLTAAGHAVGWPVARGGSQAISDALAGHLRSLGGTIHTNAGVASIGEVDGSDIVLFDMAPRNVADLYGDALPRHVEKSLRKWKHGPAAFKVDLAIEGHIPWRDAACADAGTVHLGGTLEEVMQAEHDVVSGTMPERPFVLVGQQYRCDPTRSRAPLNPIWMYAHVPHGYRGDATDTILDQVERFAPGFRDRIRAASTTNPAEFENHNPNYVGGDILTGANSVRQLIWRPRPGLNPYTLGVPGHYICSAATPPGAGVHGMCGFNAARSALATLGH